MHSRYGIRCVASALKEFHLGGSFDQSERVTKCAFQQWDLHNPRVSVRAQSQDVNRKVLCSSRLPGDQAVSIDFHFVMPKRCSASNLAAITSGSKEESPLDPDIS